ncbi:triphosphoribosyl-dephospho-CoA synthase MdcB [Gluconacetobacter takamatsuzukensis]|uniref:Probable 2-(5''-triphosphoribosyl)-3'-dephosphocoenzyme-A synthase n=1 Tax=Gluconacetobacter takamatsuzukensis TaxID=1286190 RepID=A0A7W4KFD2_9PROT|nr:triphosphoribosyl-dephospho-CoA synthase MdcB [Gluconacetobacter takamatsuzukensis]MBB2205874.1 triphosphoribosyl-dephospho-CoA synthase MdcB [Gluconacetobacter takamatsuzukensis]
MTDAARIPTSIPAGKAPVIAGAAWRSLLDEVTTWPKPGLVSHVDTGSHTDMNAETFRKSADAIAPFFADLYRCGFHGGTLAALRAIGQAAEQAMLAATGGVNTHRGAIWGLGLLSAARGRRDASGDTASCCDIVRQVWGPNIHATPPDPSSHGGDTQRRYGAGGARTEAAWGFPTIRSVGLPALNRGRQLRPDDPQAARVQCCMALIAVLEDTNLLHRGGREGLAFARDQARTFLDGGGVGHPAWSARAATIHRRFVARGLSPGGAADGLAICLFLDRTDS